MSEQKLIVFPADPHQNRDVTAHLKDFLADGWEIQSVAVSPYGERGVHVAIVAVLSRAEREPVPPYLKRFPAEE